MILQIPLNTSIMTQTWENNKIDFTFRGDVLAGVVDAVVHAELVEPRAARRSTPWR